MKVDVSRANKILANSTRRQILELIGKKEEVSYVEIRKALGHINTGKLNYHLKIIDDLVTKNSITGKYSLTFAGNAALKMADKKDETEIYDDEVSQPHHRAPSLTPSKKTKFYAPVLTISVFIVIIGVILSLFLFAPLYPNTQSTPVSVHITNYSFTINNNSFSNNSGLVLLTQFASSNYENGSTAYPPNFLYTMVFVNNGTNSISLSYISINTPEFNVTLQTELLGSSVNSSVQNSSIDVSPSSQAVMHVYLTYNGISDFSSPVNINLQASTI